MGRFAVPRGRVTSMESLQECLKVATWLRALPRLRQPGAARCPGHAMARAISPSRPPDETMKTPGTLSWWRHLPPCSIDTAIANRRAGAMPSCAHWPAKAADRYESPARQRSVTVHE